MWIAKIKSIFSANQSEPSSSLRRQLAMLSVPIFIETLLIMNAYSYIDQPTGVEESEVQSTEIRGGQGEIVITTAEPVSVCVYTLGGAVVVTRSLADSDAIAVAPGLYVVKAGNKVEKVLVK